MLRYRITYIAAFLTTVVVFVGTNSAAALFAAVVLAALFLTSVVAGSASVGTTLHFALRPSCEVGQQQNLHIELRRRIAVPTGRVEFSVICRNCMLDEETKMPVVLESGGWGHLSSFDLPLDTAACGRIEVRAQDAFSYDLLGLVRWTQPYALAESYTVYPRQVDLATALERSPQASVFGTMYDPTRRGQDMSEVFGIRDYRESDPRHAIHWKLSSKVDRLVVREASHPSSYDILLLLDRGYEDGSGNRTPDNLTGALLELAVSVSLDLCRQNLGHNVAFVSEGRVVDHAVDSPSSFERMVDALLGMPMPKRPGIDPTLFDQFRRERSFTKVILVTSLSSQREFQQISRFADLSVLHVACSSQQAMEAHGAYVMTSIPLEILESHVRSVAI